MAARINLIAALVTIIASSTSAWAQSELAGSGSITSRNYRPRHATAAEVIAPARMPREYNDEGFPQDPPEQTYQEEQRSGTYGRPQPRRTSSRRGRGQIAESQAWDDPNAPQGSCRGHMVVHARNGERNESRDVETLINLSNMGRNARNSQSVDLVDQHDIGSTQLGTMNWTAYHTADGRPRLEIEITDRSSGRVVYRRQIQSRSWSDDIRVTIRGSDVIIPLSCSVSRQVARY